MWTIYARNPSLQRDAEIDYTSAELTSRFCAVGKWELVLDARLPAANSLKQPGWGIEVVNEDMVTVLAGPVDNLKRDRDENTNTYTFYGSDDNVYLAERLAHPQPATAAPPYNTNEYDVRGPSPCSTVLRSYVDVNLGPSALGPRKQFGLTLAADPVVGATVVGRARWQNLLDFLQGLSLSGGGVGFQNKQVGTALQFQTYMPVDRSGTVQFSLDKGNLASYTASTGKSKVNYAYIGGGGEGTARTVREGQDTSEIIRWRRIELFIDRRDTTDPSELDQEIVKQLADGKGEVSVSVEPVDLDGSTYLTNYNLGDKVSAVVDDDTITDVIREVKVTLSPEKAPEIVPSIGNPGLTVTPLIITKVDNMSDRVRNLERR
jgi:Siphovirus ReqiPepy6 Gp37-like protein